jgi:hypothetical protein
MNMKEHILAALREQIDRWEALLASFEEEQLTAPFSPSDWSMKDHLAHLMAWQQRSIARMEAALSDREPEYPVWLPGVNPEEEVNTDQINAWIYEAHRERTWAEVYHDWREGYIRFIKSGEGISEEDLLDEGRYLWLEGHPLALVLLASYDHHQEHYDNLIDQRRRQGSR